MDAAPVVTVTNTDDSGPGSLRQAMADAGPGSVIQFASGIAGQTIVLTTGPLVTNQPLTIEAPISAGMTISGNLSSRVFILGVDANLVLRNLTLVHGKATGGLGGALQTFGKVTLDHSLITDSEAEDGGGISVEELGQLLMLNSTLSGNTATDVGGAIVSQGAVTIRNSTIAFNDADVAGGFFGVIGSLSMRNTIVANNTAGSSPNCHLKPDVSFNFSGTNLANEDPCDASFLSGDPQLALLANNGGPTKTHALTSSLSYALDHGTSCTESTDQRYIARNQGASCDIGAFEFNDFGAFTITVGPNIAVNAKTGVATVTGTIRCSRPASALLSISMSQTQKVTGRFTIIVQSDGTVGVNTCGTTPTSWSRTLAPQSGKFQPGSATGTATTINYPLTFLPATVSSELKVFQVK
jgi:hypothetical protein